MVEDSNGIKRRTDALCYHTTRKVLHLLCSIYNCVLAHLSEEYSCN
jgi:hypothetical protein